MTTGKIEFHIGQDYACLLGADDTTDTNMAMVRDGDDARRLAACWNALDGLPTEAIEGKGAEIRNNYFAFLRLQEQVASLQKKLAEISKLLKQET